MDHDSNLYFYDPGDVEMARRKEYAPLSNRATILWLLLVIGLPCAALAVVFTAISPEGLKLLVRAWPHP